MGPNTSLPSLPLSPLKREACVPVFSRLSKIQLLRNKVGENSQVTAGYIRADSASSAEARGCVYLQCYTCEGFRVSVVEMATICKKNGLREITVLKLKLRSSHV